MINFKCTRTHLTFSIPSRHRSIFSLADAQNRGHKELNQEYRKLLQLVDEELALWDEENSKVKIEHSNLYSLSREEMDVLGLPEFYPFALDLDLPDSITDPEFRILIDFKKANGELIVKPTVKGSYIKISDDESYLFDAKTFKLLEDIKSYNKNRDKFTRPQKWKRIAQVIKDLKEANRKVHPEFKEYDIVSMEQFSAKLEEQDDGTLSVLPVPLAEDFEVDKDDPELKEKKVQKEALSSEEQESFQQQFHQRRNIPNQYLLKSRKLLVYDKELLQEESGNHDKDVLSQFKDLQNLKGEEKKQFVKEPGSFLNAEYVDLTDISERVHEIGQYHPTVLPFVPKSDNEWFPEEGGVIIDGEQVRIEPENRKQLIEEIDKAIGEGRDEVEYNSHTYPATEEMCDALEKLEKADESTNEERSSEAEKPYNQNDANNTILIIKDNYFDVDGAFEPGSARKGDLVIPDSTKADVDLFPHQVDGIKWMQKLWINGAKGGLLADDMGLGKTLQALLFAAWVKEQSADEKDLGPVLVAAPLTLLENWCNEYEKFLDRSIFGEPLKLHGSVLAQSKINGFGISTEREIDTEEHNIEELINDRGGLLLDIAALKNVDLIVTTYEAIRDYQFSFSRINWSVMILDEIQKIKNPETLVSKAVKAMNYEFGLGLTGTPVENSWNELWSIMDFVQPGRLGSLTHFNEKYQKKLEEPEVNQEELGKQLKRDLGGSIRRRMKEDHIDGLPERIVEPEFIEMTDYQKQRYGEVLDEAKNSESDKHVLTLLSALRDISLCPYLPYKHEQKLMEMSSAEIIANSAKLGKVFSILSKIKNRREKAIIFLISRKMQSVLQKLMIEKYGFRPYVINGTVQGGRRQVLVDKFQESDGFNLIIMSPEAAGVGLNVTGANHVIHLSRPWNPAKEDQASDRVYRINQDKKVTIYIPIAQFSELGEGRSFDEKLHYLLETKRHLSKSVMIPAKVNKSELMSLESGMLEKETASTKDRSLKLTDVDDLTGMEFEKFCAKLLQKEGYIVNLTEVNDQGADIVARLPERKEGYLVQCKSKLNPTSKIGNKAVQEIYAARGFYEKTYQDYTFKTTVITNSKGYTRQAHQLANSNNVTLWDRSYLKDLVRKHNITLGALAL